MSVTTDYFVTVFRQGGAGQLASTLGGLSRDYGRLEASQASALRQGAVLSAVGAAGIRLWTSAMKESLKAGAEAQRYKTGFVTNLGEARGKKLYKDIEQFSLTSNLSDKVAKEQSQFLLAVGVGHDKLVKRLEQIENQVDSSGGGNDRFKGIVQTMGQIENSTYASRMQIRRLEIRGVQANKILQKELGLTADQVANLGKQYIKGSVVAEALYRGMEKVGGGKAAENLNKTYVGQLSQAEDATEQLKATIGQIVMPDATKFLRGLNQALITTRDFAREHPRVTKGFVYGAGIGSLALIVLGYMKLKKIGQLTYTALERAANGGATAVDRVTRSTVRDIAAESKKTRVARAEAAARHAAAAAAEHQAAANTALAATYALPAAGMGVLPGVAPAMLPAGAAAIAPGMLPAAGAAGAPALPAAGGAAIGGAEAAGAAAAVGFGARFRGIWAALMSRWTATKMGQIMGRQLFTDQFIGTMYEGGVSPLSRLGQFYGTATVGNAVGAVGAGATAGWGVYDSLSNEKNQQAVQSVTGVQLGEGSATALAATLGIAAGALALAFPPATAAIIGLTLAAKATEYAVNKLYNEPAEKAAEQGSGAANTALHGDGMEKRLNDAISQANRSGSSEDYRKVASIYAEMGKNAAIAGDEQSQIQNGLMSQRFYDRAMRAKMPGTAEYDIAQYTASVNSTGEGNKEAKIAAFARNRRLPGTGPVYPVDGMWRDPELEAQQAQNEKEFGGRKLTSQERAAVQQARLSDAGVRATVGPEQRSGGNKITIEVNIPDRTADAQARRKSSQTMTPAMV